MPLSDEDAKKLYEQHCAMTDKSRQGLLGVAGDDAAMAEGIKSAWSVEPFEDFRRQLETLSAEELASVRRLLAGKPNHAERVHQDRLRAAIGGQSWLEQN